MECLPCLGHYLGQQKQNCKQGPALKNRYWGKKAHVTVVPFLRLDAAVYPLKEEVWMSESTVVYLKKKALTNVVYINYIAWGQNLCL